MVQKSHVGYKAKKCSLSNYFNTVYPRRSAHLEVVSFFIVHRREHPCAVPCPCVLCLCTGTGLNAFSPSKSFLTRCSLLMEETCFTRQHTPVDQSKVSHFYTDFVPAILPKPQQNTTILPGISKLSSSDDFFITTSKRRPNRTFGMTLRWLPSERLLTLFSHLEVAHVNNISEDTNPDARTRRISREYLWPNAYSIRLH